jgi:hypothetical protein
MQGAIGNVLRNTLGITKVQYSHGAPLPPPPSKKKSGPLGACCLPHWLQEFFCLCVFFTIFGLVWSTTNILGTWGTPQHRILNMLPSPPNRSMLCHVSLWSLALRSPHPPLHPSTIYIHGS